MKIALVILHADPMRGGAERYTIDLAAALAKRGHEVSLLATSFSGVPASTKQVSLASGGLTRNSQYRHMLDSLDEHLDRTRYDIVHAMLPVRHCDVYHPHAGIAKEMTNWSDALRNPRRRTMAVVEQELLMRDDGPVVLCLSQYVKELTRKHYPLPEKRLATLFNAVDINRFDPMADLDARFRLREEWAISEEGEESVVALFVAQDFERKGLPAALNALRRIGSPNIVLFILGGDDRKPYEDAIFESGIGGRVEFLGTTSDPRPMYSAADFFILPTKHDPCSLVVLEALAMGLPVISTQFNGACEIMTDGVHGFVLPDPTDADALAAAMRKMLDPELRTKMSAACLELRTKLSYEQHLDRLIGIYQQCAS